MAAKLDYIITASNFETIRDSIASILVTEIANQSLLQGTISTAIPPLATIPNPDLIVSIYAERFSDVGIGEGNVIVVKVASIPLGDQTPISQVAKAVFNIDVYCNSTETVSVEGYYRSAVKLQKLCGVIRHIIQSPYYDRLGLANGIIQRRSVSSIDFNQPSDNNDGAYARMARITLEVDIVESQNGISVTTAEGYDTFVTLEETDLGYKYTKNN
jgi:hypothetical protein